MSKCEKADTCPDYQTTSVVCNQYLPRERSYCGTYRKNSERIISV